MKKKRKPVKKKIKRPPRLKTKNYFNEPSSRKYPTSD